MVDSFNNQDELIAQLRADNERLAKKLQNEDKPLNLDDMWTEYVEACKTRHEIRKEFTQLNIKNLNAVHNVSFENHMTYNFPKVNQIIQSWVFPRQRMIEI